MNRIRIIHRVTGHSFTVIQSRLATRKPASVKSPDDGKKLTPDEIRQAISDRDSARRLRLTQIPAPPDPITDPESVLQKIRHDEQSALWSQVKDIKMPYHVMHHLLSQKEVSRKPIPADENSGNNIHRKPRGRSAYNIWFQENKEELTGRLPHLPDGLMAANQMTRFATSKWNKLPRETKDLYRKKAADLRLNQQQD